MKPMCMKQMKKFREEKPKNVANAEKKPSFILTKEFKGEKMKDGIVYVVLAKENNYLTPTSPQKSTLKSVCITIQFFFMSHQKIYLMNYH